MNKKTLFITCSSLVCVLILFFSINAFQISKEKKIYQQNQLLAMENFVMGYENVIELQKKITAESDSRKREALLDAHIDTSKVLEQFGYAISSFPITYEKMHSDTALPSYYDGNVSRNVQLTVLLGDFRAETNLEEKEEATTELQAEIQDFKEYIEIFREELDLKELEI